MLTSPAARGQPRWSLAAAVRQEFRDAVRAARAADLPVAPAPKGRRLCGRWHQIFRGATAVEALRATHVLMRPMRGEVQRHFIGENIEWEQGWARRWLEVDGATLAVCQDPNYEQRLAQAQLSPGHDMLELVPSEVPDGRAHCFTVLNLGVEVALQAGSAAELAAWLEKVELAGQPDNRRAFTQGGRGWQVAGLTAELVPRLRGLLKLFDVPEFRSS
eukprot:SAG22_NODE_4368_length_1290_cov_1.660789_1_plen_217_part_00